jgi:tRNA-specific 2-thiouridylase
VKLRYRQRDLPCRIEAADGGVTLRFEAPQRGAAPGQYAVFYDGEECLGGAAIMASIQPEESWRTASRRAASSRSEAGASTTTP